MSDSSKDKPVIDRQVDNWWVHGPNADVAITAEILLNIFHAVRWLLRRLWHCIKRK